MTRSATPLPRPLRNFACACAAALAAASIWAAGTTEEGYMLDAPLWREEVGAARLGHWPAEGWYRLTLRDKAVEVRVAAPDARARAAGTDGEEDDTVYVRVPGADLREGLRPRYRFQQAIVHPRSGQQYELKLGKTRFSFTAHSDEQGTHLDIVYGGQEHRYTLGLPAAATTVHGVADLDGDAMPDFIVEVGDERYLLLSTRARPGMNLPSAQLWALGR